MPSRVDRKRPRARVWSTPSPNGSERSGLAQGLGKMLVPLCSSDLKGKSLGLLNDVEYISFDPKDPQSALASLPERISGLAREQRQQDLVVFLCVAVVGLLLFAYVADS
jgi:hypothetical protein